MGRVVVAAAAAMWVIPISILVNRVVPEPYMDEIFHIPQAQRYCRGDFKTWDPMITTPPGLYYVSLAYVTSLFPWMWLAKAAQSLPDFCSTAVLRSVNGAMAIICSVLIYDLLICLRPTLRERKATVYAIMMGFYPIHWFFTFLYYTDVASLTIVLAMYLASLKKRYWVSAVLAVFAIFLRQTNVVWMMFVAANGAISYVDGHSAKRLDKLNNKVKENSEFAGNKRVPFVPTLTRRRMASSTNDSNSLNSEASKISLCHAPGFIEEILDIALKLWCFKWKVLITFAPFVLALLGFVIFVIWNGGIVLGAKEAHVASPHFAQMLYFGLASAAALTPVHFNLYQARNIYGLLMKNKVLYFQALVSLIVGFIMVHFFSIAHPYLLADNRHYTFYIWRKIIQAHWMMKYLLIPLYLYSWFSIINILGKMERRIWVLSFFVATALVLIPAPLIEFRYFTIPFYFLILHSQINDDISWLIMGALYICVDIFTIFVFLYRPFHWDHEPGTQRFIW